MTEATFPVLLRVISSKEGRTALRVPGVTGLRFFNGTEITLYIAGVGALKPLNNVDPVALLQSYHGFLNVWLLGNARAVPLALPVKLCNVDVKDRDIEALFHCFFNSYFVGSRRYLESVFARFLQNRAFFGNGGLDKDSVDIHLLVSLFLRYIIFFVRDDFVRLRLGSGFRFIR